MTSRADRPGITGRGRGRGVALLEVIVALTLLSGTGLALFAWINQSLESASRIARVDSEARTKLNALALLESVNPAIEAVGTREVAGWRIDWRAQDLTPPRRNAGFMPGAEGPWLVGLYKLSVSATGTQADPGVKFDVVKVGWRRWQAPATATQ